MCRERFWLAWYGSAQYSEALHRTIATVRLQLTLVRADDPRRMRLYGDLLWCYLEAVGVLRQRIALCRAHMEQPASAPHVIRAALGSPAEWLMCRPGGRYAGAGVQSHIVRRSVMPKWEYCRIDWLERTVSDEERQDLVGWGSRECLVMVHPV